MLIGCFGVEQTVHFRHNPCTLADLKPVKIRLFAPFNALKLPHMRHYVLRAGSRARIARKRHSKPRYQKALHYVFNATGTARFKVIAVFHTFIGSLYYFIGNFLAVIIAVIIACQFPVEYSDIFPEHIAYARKQHIKRRFLHNIEIGYNIFRRGAFNCCLCAVKQRRRSCGGIAVHGGRGSRNSVRQTQTVGNHPAYIVHNARAYRQNKIRQRRVFKNIRIGFRVV